MRWVICSLSTLAEIDINTDIEQHSSLLQCYWDDSGLRGPSGDSTNWYCAGERQLQQFLHNTHHFLSVFSFVDAAGVRLVSAEADSHGNAALK